MQKGQKIGSYEIVRKLCSSAWWEVHRARPAEQGAEVLIQVLGAELTTDASAARTFREDVERVAGLGSPVFPKLLEVGTTAEGRLYLVLESLEGQTLRRRVETNGPMNAAQARQALFPVLDAMENVHRTSVIHGSLDPDAVFLHQGPDGTVTPKILGLGVGRLIESVRRTRSVPTASNLETTIDSFAAPETVRGGAGVGPSADIYGLGALCFYALTGREPETIDPLSGLWATVGGSSPSEQALPKKMADVIRKATSELTVARYVDIGSLRSALADAWASLGSHPDQGPSADVRGPEGGADSGWAVQPARPHGEPKRMARPAAARNSYGRAAADTVRPSSATQPAQARSRSVLVLVLAVGILNVGGMVAYVLFAGQKPRESRTRRYRAVRSERVRVQAPNQTVRISDSRPVVPEPPRTDADRLLRKTRTVHTLFKARAALRERKFAEALDLAREAYAAAPSANLARSIGLAGCLHNRPEMAGWALGKLIGDDRKAVERMCAEKGVVPLTPGKDEAGSLARPPRAVQPTGPSAAQIGQVMRQHRRRVGRCFERYKSKGMVRVRIQIMGSTGRVSSVEIGGKFAGTRTGRCIARAVRKIRFPRFAKESVTVVYPFLFR